MMLEKVEFSESTTPIVPVLKPDGNVRICGYYKVTTNPVLDVPEHPMPKADDLFTQLNGGEKFAKLDLSSVYQQVLLDDESSQYVMINTHLGSFRYTRLPFGAASSPAIFQKVMDSVTSGLQGVGGILDDLIVTGANDENHFRNLEDTLDRLSNIRAKFKKEKFECIHEAVGGILCVCRGSSWIVTLPLVSCYGTEILFGFSKLLSQIHY